MRLRTFGHLTGEAVQSIRDNGLLAVAAMSTVAISLLVLAIVGVLAANMQHLTSVLDAQVQIVGYFKAAETPAAEASVTAQVRALPGVTKVVFVDKAQAIATLGSQLGSGASLISEVGADNPLPDSLEIFVDDPRDVASVYAEANATGGFDQINNAQDVVDKLFGFTQAVRYVGAFLVAALALATLVVIGNAVRVAVYARRDQIAIMKLVGATNGFIRWPFFIEGAILGLCGAVVSGAIVWWGYLWIAELVNHTLPFLQLLAPTPFLPHLVEALVVVGVALGAAGSAISVRRHLNV